MSDVAAVAPLAAIASLLESALTLVVGFRQVRRSVSTSNGEPHGRVLEARLEPRERRLDFGAIWLPLEADRRVRVADLYGGRSG